MLKTMTFVLAAMAALLNAQELLPELAEPAAKHKAADEALDKQKQEAVALAAKSYVSALDGIEKAATAKNELDQVAAAVKEREAAVAGTLEPDLPAALPQAKLLTTRKALLMKLEQINKDFTQRRKQTDGDFLRVLATLQAKAVSNPELARQLAAEKAALLGGGGASESGAKSSKVPRGKNVVVNGGFEKIDNEWLDGWSRSSCATIETENGNKFLRFCDSTLLADGTAALQVIRQDIDVPKDAREAAVSGRIRTTGCVSRAKVYPIIPQIQIHLLDKEDKEVACVGTQWKKNGDWEKIKATLILPKDAAVKAYVQIVNGQCPGKIDFDDVEVTFK